MKLNLSKMRTELDETVNYHLEAEENKIRMNEFLGRKLKLNYTGNISCVNCGSPTKKSFNQGYCYKCFITLAQCDMCIMKPETCHYDAGTCREPDWAQNFCFQPHFVYLANSSGIKVGITRQNQIPTRWIDQGAVQALPIIKVSSRYISGVIEVILAQKISDKTSWQRMLKNQIEQIELTQRRDELLCECESELKKQIDQFGAHAIEFLPDAQEVNINYPVLKYPVKVKSFNFDKQPDIEGTLEGIKGQYLIFDSGVINIRKYSGYEVEINVF